MNTRNEVIEALTNTLSEHNFTIDDKTPVYYSLNEQPVSKMADEIDNLIDTIESYLGLPIYHENDFNILEATFHKCLLKYQNQHQKMIDEMANAVLAFQERRKEDFKYAQ